MKLKVMFDEYNVIVKSFRMTKGRYEVAPINDLELKLIFDMVIDGRKYNLSLFFVVVVLMMLIF